jgi:hypothetical protein
MATSLPRPVDVTEGRPHSTTPQRHEDVSEGGAVATLTGVNAPRGREFLNRKRFGSESCRGRSRRTREKALPEGASGGRKAATFKQSAKGLISEARTCMTQNSLHQINPSAVSGQPTISAHTQKGMCTVREHLPLDRIRRHLLAGMARCSGRRIPPKMAI